MSERRLDSRRERGSVSLFHLKRRGLVEICPSASSHGSISSGQTTGRAGKEGNDREKYPGSPKEGFLGRTLDKVNQCRPGFCLQRVSSLGLALRVVVRLQRPGFGSSLLCSSTAVGPCLSEPQGSHLQNGALQGIVRTV